MSVAIAPLRPQFGAMISEFGRTPDLSELDVGITMAVLIDNQLRYPRRSAFQIADRVVERVLRERLARRVNGSLG